MSELKVENPVAIEQTIKIKNLTEQDFNFKRESFVKELYNPRHFLNNFNYVIFSSPLDFVNAIQNDFYTPKNILVIQIHTLSHLNLMKRIINKSKIGDLCELFLHIKDWKLYSRFEGIEIKKFSVIMEYIPEMRELLENLFVDGKQTVFCEWRNKNRLFFRFNITFENIDTIFEEMIDVYQRELTRFFDITVDYASFSDAKISDMPRIQYKCSTFYNWRSESFKNNKQKNKPIIVTRNYKHIIKKAFVSSENIYLSEQNFIEHPEEPIFDLQMNKTGEDIHFKKLNNVRQVIDLTKDMIVSRNITKMNTYYIDLYQNKKISGFINELPIISEILGWWLL